MTISRLKMNIKMSVNVKRHSSSHHSPVLIPHLKGNYCEQLSSLIYTQTHTHRHTHTHTNKYPVAHKRTQCLPACFYQKKKKQGDASKHNSVISFLGLCCPVISFYTSWLSFSRDMRDLYSFLRRLTQLIFTR